MSFVAQPDERFYDGGARYVDSSQRLRARGPASGPNDRGEGAALTVGHSPPRAVERLVKLLVDGLEGIGEGGLVGAFAADGPLPEEVGEQYRPLRVTASDIEQRAQCVAHLAAGVLEAGSDELGEVLARQRSERHRARLTVERALTVVEKGSHHARMGTGEDVSRFVVMLFDHAPDRPVDRGARREHFLELVEADQHTLAASLEQLLGQLKQLE